jgi:microsomal dipeptidase-like Zn-dependent dipeptidase
LLKGSVRKCSEFWQPGYQDADIASILGVNWMRVLKEAWRPIKMTTPAT